MEFLKKMKSREMLEMGLKTIIGVLAGLVLIILMEGMIYGIYMDKIKENKETFSVVADCVVYCEEVGEDEYQVYVHNTETGAWHIESITKTKEQVETKGYKDVVYRVPNAFDVSITGTHYIVMAVFIAGVLGFYGWRFYKLNKEYKGFEKKLKKTGKIFA